MRLTKIETPSRNLDSLGLARNYVSGGRLEIYSGRSARIGSSSFPLMILHLFQTNFVPGWTALSK
jgi:hypothetical protein